MLCVALCVVGRVLLVVCCFVVCVYFVVYALCLVCCSLFVVCCVLLVVCCVCIMFLLRPHCSVLFGRCFLFCVTGSFFLRSLLRFDCCVPLIFVMCSSLVVVC